MMQVVVSLSDQFCRILICVAIEHSLHIEMNAHLVKAAVAEVKREESCTAVDGDCRGVCPVLW